MNRFDSIFNKTMGINEDSTQVGVTPQPAGQTTPTSNSSTPPNPSGNTSPQTGTSNTSTPNNSAAQFNTVDDLTSHLAGVTDPNQIKQVLSNPNALRLIGTLHS